jgi:hypothetical protein
LLSPGPEGFGFYAGDELGGNAACAKRCDSGRNQIEEGGLPISFPTVRAMFRKPRGFVCRKWCEIKERIQLF